MDTYTKECRYLDTFDIGVYLERIDNTLDMIFESTSEELDKLKNTNPEGITKLVLQQLNQNFEVFALALDSIRDLKEECYALENRPTR